MVEFYPDAALLPGVKRFTGDTVYYWLFTNDVTPNASHTIDSFTTVADILPLHKDIADFTLQSLGAHIARITATDLVFVSLASTYNVYGYMVTTSASGTTPAGDLIKAARFDGAPYVCSMTDMVNVVPTFALKPIS